MSIINVGSLTGFALPTRTPKSRDGGPAIMREGDPAREFRDGPAAEQEPEFLLSEGRWGLTLKSLKLLKSHEWFGDRKNELYFVAWSWDFSGAAPVVYPGVGVAADGVVIPMTAGNEHVLIGAGVPLFPPRKVRGGLATKIMVWEADKDVRDFGAAMSEVAGAINDSQLTQILGTIVSGAGVPGVVVTAVAQAAIALTGIVGQILQANGEDPVDLFQGCWYVGQPWESANERYAGEGAEITLGRVAL